MDTDFVEIGVAVNKAVYLSLHIRNLSDMKAISYFATFVILSGFVTVVMMEVISSAKKKSGKYFWLYVSHPNMSIIVICDFIYLSRRIQIILQNAQDPWNFPRRATIMKYWSGQAYSVQITEPGVQSEKGNINFQ